MFANKIITTVLDKILPAHCELCGGSATSLLCSPCARQLPRIRQCCEVCALPLDLHSPDHDEDGICGECLNRRPDFDKLIAPFVYRDEVAWMINKYKHKKHTQYGSWLGEQLERELKEHLEDNEKPDLITAVPLHWSRLLTRGFNQAELLARRISSKVDIPYKNILRKTRRTTQQQNLKRNERLKNLREVFDLRENIEGKFISIVDDVVTTGATAQTLANLLIEAGARRVEIWALARTPKVQANF